MQRRRLHSIRLESAGFYGAHHNPPPPWPGHPSAHTGVLPVAPDVLDARGRKRESGVPFFHGHVDSSVVSSLRRRIRRPEGFGTCEENPGVALTDSSLPQQAGVGGVFINESQSLPSSAAAAPLQVPSPTVHAGEEPGAHVEGAARGRKRENGGPLCQGAAHKRLQGGTPDFVLPRRPPSVLPASPSLQGLTRGSDGPEVCHCRLPAYAGGELLIWCQACGVEYHPSCVGLSPAQAAALAGVWDWYCPPCRWELPPSLANALSAGCSPPAPFTFIFSSSSSATAAASLSSSIFSSSSSSSFSPSSPPPPPALAAAPVYHLDVRRPPLPNGVSMRIEDEEDEEDECVEEDARQLLAAAAAAAGGCGGRSWEQELRSAVNSFSTELRARLAGGFGEASRLPGVTTGLTETARQLFLAGKERHALLVKLKKLSSEAKRRVSAAGEVPAREGGFFLVVDPREPHVMRWCFADYLLQHPDVFIHPTLRVWNFPVSDAPWAVHGSASLPVDFQITEADDLDRPLCVTAQKFAGVAAAEALDLADVLQSRVAIAIVDSVCMVKDPAYLKSYSKASKTYLRHAAWLLGRVRRICQEYRLNLELANGVKDLALKVLAREQGVPVQLGQSVDVLRGLGIDRDPGRTYEVFASRVPVYEQDDGTCLAWWPHYSGPIPQLQLKLQQLSLSAMTLKWMATRGRAPPARAAVSDFLQARAIQRVQSGLAVSQAMDGLMTECCPSVLHLTSAFRVRPAVVRRCLQEALPKQPAVVNNIVIQLSAMTSGLFKTIEHVLECGLSVKRLVETLRRGAGEGVDGESDGDPLMLFHPCCVPGSGRVPLDKVINEIERKRASKGDAPLMDLLRRGQVFTIYHEIANKLRLHL